MRKEYEMTQEQYDRLLRTCQPVPMIMLQCGSPPSLQERANAAWKQLGTELNFDYMTARQSKSARFFTAESLKEEE